MVLTKEENELLTRVGPGTPGGELLRRYWHPILPASELTPEKPTKFVRVLGEDLVLFLDKSGRVGLLADRCAHRGVSLCYGRVEERGISCAYHGWLYNTGGEILETPPERNDAILKTVRQPSYPVQKLAGIYWAYLGPLPAPIIPPYDTLVRTDGIRTIVVQPQLDCNWFQAMENSVDSAHLQILHQEFIGRGRTPASTTRGFIDDIKENEFELSEIGVMKKRVYANGGVDEHPLIFPNILRQGFSTQMRVPMDDEHTYHIRVMFEPFPSKVANPDPPVSYDAPYKDPPGGLFPDVRYNQRSVPAQDHMAWETQGRIADRTTEHLSYSDRGISMFRKLMRDEIEKVQRGEDPMNVYRDPKQPMIDTNIEESTRVEEATAGIRHVRDTLPAGTEA